MRIAFLYILFFTLIGGCSVNNLEPNQTNTFLKFYYETNEMESKDLIVLDDGYLVLSTFSDTSSMLLKTDLLGNKIWAQSINYFMGSSLTETTDGYIVSGDSINTLDGTTFMQLIKTNKDTGARLASTFIGTGAEHGSGVTFTANDEIIGLGYTSTTQGDSLLLMGYDLNLNDIWPSPRKYLSESPANSLYEENGLISWLSYYTNQNSVSVTTVLHNNEGVESNPTLFNGLNLMNTDGDLVKTPVGYAVVQSINNGNGESKIGVSSLINGSISNETIIDAGEFDTGNYNGYALSNTLNGLLIAATTDRHLGSDDKARTDLDLLLLEVDINGNIVTEGINQTFGGNGDEIPVRIKRDLDGSYIILGTSINTKGAQQTFLLKTNSKGLLN